MDKTPNLNINQQVSADVPTFTCLVYVSERKGKHFARVANLAGIEVSGLSERDVLGKVITAFKMAIREKLTAKKTVSWIEPPMPIAENEQKRIVPVHL